MIEKLELKHLAPYQDKNLNDLENEVWKEFPDNTQYLISNLGRVKSKRQVVNHNSGSVAIKKERILTQTDNGSGYLSCGLTFNGKTKTMRVSRIVATTFIPNSNNKPQVNHINGNKKDNAVKNLEWTTSGENVRHAWNNGLAKKQSSFLYIQERLIKINPYLSYNPRVKTPLGLGTVIIDQNCYRIQYDNGKLENLVKSVRFWKDDFKLILRDISDLTKEIEVNGEKFVPINEIYKINNKVYIYKPTNFDLEITIDTEDFSEEIDLHDGYLVVQKLLEYHFDIYGLIEQNLAIDINTLNNE